MLTTEWQVRSGGSGYRHRGGTGGLMKDRQGWRVEDLF